MILCGLCEQKERAKLAGEVERPLAETRKLKKQPKTCQEEVDSLCQQTVLETSDLQVSKSGFSPLESRIIRFHLPIFEERELLCSAFALMRKIL
jgi:hypothetical protein